MKKLFLLICVFAAVAFTSCQSNEDKANALIAAQSESLFSVQASELHIISTFVEEAKQTVFNDSTCWRAASDYKQLEKVLYTTNEEIFALEAEISALVSAKQNEALVAEKQAVLAKTKNNVEVIQNLMNTFIQLIAKTEAGFEPDVVVGWNVTQKLAFKNEGQDCEANIRFVMDKDFKNIFIFEDFEDHLDADTRLLLKSYLNHEFDKLQPSTQSL